MKTKGEYESEISQLKAQIATARNDALRDALEATLISAPHTCRDPGSFNYGVAITRNIVKNLITTPAQEKENGNV